MLSVADDLGFSQTQLKSIGMLVHALYNNPKVLYAPNNSAANLIINKVNSCIFYLVVSCRFMTVKSIKMCKNLKMAKKFIKLEVREYPSFYWCNAICHELPRALSTVWDRYKRPARPLSQSPPIGRLLGLN